MSDEIRMSYIGRKPCGCVVCAAVDSPQYRKEVARDIAKWVRSGLTIERVPCSDVRTLPFGCTHKKATARQEALL